MKKKELKSALYSAQMRTNQLLEEREYLLEEVSRYEPFARAGGALMEALRDTARVLAFGQKKYPKNDWQEMSSRCHVDAALRHLGRASDLGIDDESGSLHYYHAITRLLMAAAVELGDKK